MKILIPNLNIPCFNDIAQCLESIKSQNIEIIFWNPHFKSMIDVFDEIHPDIIFVDRSQLDASFAFICQEFYNDFKYILHSTTELPKQLIKLPEIIITYHEIKHLFKDHETIAMKPVARVAQIHNAQYDNKMHSEILINTTGVNFEQDKTIIQLLLFLIANYKTKIIGNSQIRLHNYLGKVDIFERANFIKSAKIVIDINGSDCFDSAYLKTPSLSLGKLNNTILHFADTKTLKSNIDTILNKKLARTRYVDECYKEICNGKTSYHFASQIFDKINENDISQKLLAYIKGLIS